MICPKCGKENVDAAKFCIKCGSAVDSIAPIQVSENVNHKSVESNTSGIESKRTSTPATNWIYCPFCKGRIKDGSIKCAICNVTLYKNYSDVPWYRKNSFAILAGLTFIPAVLPVLVTGDIYYIRSGQLRVYSRTARIFLILVCLFAFGNSINLISKSIRNSLQADIANYKKQITEIGHLEEEAMHSYNELVTAKITDRGVLLQRLNSEVIPKYEKFKARMSAITPKTKELQDIHTQYIRGISLQLEGILQVQKGITENDNQLLQSAKTNIEEGGRTIQRTIEAIKSLSEKGK